MKKEYLLKKWFNLIILECIFITLPAQHDIVPLHDSIAIHYADSIQKMIDARQAVIGMKYVDWNTGDELYLFTENDDNLWIVIISPKRDSEGIAEFEHACLKYISGCWYVPLVSKCSKGNTTELEMRRVLVSAYHILLREIYSRK